MTTPQEALATHSRLLKAMQTKLDATAEALSQLKAANELVDRKIQAIKLGGNFRKLMEMVAEMVIPFHYVVNLTLPGLSTARVVQPFQTTSKGWYFADRVHASYRPTAGAQAGQWRPLTHADPTIAAHDASGVGVVVPDVLEFDWEYSESRTNMNRQNDSQTIPGDLLFRRDGDGYLIGGDPWAPRTTISVAATPRVAPTNNGVLVFTFIGSLCLNTPETAVQSWLERRNALGFK